MDKSILNLTRRKELYEFIYKNSGLHMRDISRKLNIPLTSLKYHLTYLEKKGFIISREDGKYSRFYISLTIGEKEKMILNCLRKRTILHIILWFFIAVQCSQRDISRYLEKHPTTIRFHIRRMLHAGIIEHVSINKGVIYNNTPPITINRSQVSSEKIYVLQDPWIIYDLLIKNKENLGDKEVVNSIIEYVEFIISEGVPTQIQNREDTKNSILNTFNRFFFPPSFCS
jgi:DNA-binding Lrp family transcriptional regulator